MAVIGIGAIYEFSLCQLAAESYLENASRLGEIEYLNFVLRKGTNRTGYNKSDNNDLQVEGLNQGWPGLTRMTDPQIEEFTSKFEVVHQWSDNPSTGSAPGIRPAEDLVHDAGLILNSQSMLANTGFSATLVNRKGTNEYTLSFRSTESRPWEKGGDKERDMAATDALSVAGVGFALAQLDAMEKYYQWLKENGLLPAGSILNVTGYSLGGHLATVFTEIHRNDADIQFGETVTFNGAGRGNWDDSVGTESQFITYFRAVLKDPTCAGLILADFAPDKVARATAWAVGNSVVALFSESPDNGATGSISALEKVEKAAVASAGLPFDPKSIYQDMRYVWAVVATILTYDLTPDLPLDAEVTVADDRITQVVGYENLFNVNMTANSQVNGPERRVAIESQPLLDKAGGFVGLPGDFGFGHSIDLITDSLVLQRAIHELDNQFTLDEFLEVIPFVSRRTTDNVIGTDYEADALENVLDGLRRIILGSGITPTVFHEGAGGFGDWDSRNGFHNNILMLTQSDTFQAVAGRVHFSLSDPFQGIVARNDFASLLGLVTLSPVYLRATAGNQEVVEQALSAAWPDIHAAWADDQALGRGENFSDSWIQDRGAMLAGLVQVNGENSADNSVINRTQEEGVYYLDMESGQDVTVLGGRLEPVSLNVRFDRAWTVDPLNGGDGIDHLYGGIGGSELHGGGGDDVLQGLIRSDILFGDGGRDFLGGGGGDDHLSGGKDADRLEGGSGFDEYLISSGDGVDTIFDSDGAGFISIDGTRLSDGQQVAENAWVSLDGRFRYALLTGKDGSQFLQVFPVGGVRDSNVTMLFVENFQNYELGLALANAPGEEIAEDGIIRGDVTPAWLIGLDAENQPVQALQYDSLGNIIGAPGTQARADMLMGSSGPDQILGGEGNDTLLGRDGSDRLSGENGADFMAAGLGEDSLEGGAGDDLLYGDADPWASETQAALWPVPADATAPVSGAVFVESGIHWARFQVDAASLAVSNANPDAITPILLLLSPSRFGTATLLGYPRNAFGQSQGAADVLLGGDGNDLAFGEAGNDLLRGEAGSDSLYGGSGDDFLDGGLDDDLLLGDDLTFAAFTWSQLDFAGQYRSTPFQETYEQEFGNDLLRGGEGADYLFGMAGADALFGEGGNDFVVGDFFEVVSIPVLRLDEAGTDFIMDDSTRFAEAVSYHGNDFLDGGEGDDYLVGLSGSDQLFGGAGADVLVADGNADEVQGRYGDDSLDGGLDNDLLFGSGGDDALVGGDGDDVLWGDEYAGSDGAGVSGWGGAPMGGSSNGGQLSQDQHGKDSLEGGEGNDTLIGGGRDDRLDGGNGNDLLFGDGIGVAHEGNDRLYGGKGDDELQGNGGDDLLMGEEGADHLSGQDGNDLLSGGEGDDGMNGGAGSDALQGGMGLDTLFGGEGSDTLEGGEGDDKLSGDSGDDTLWGGLGVDYLGGGEGDDRFVLSAGHSFAGGELMEVIDGGAGANTLEIQQTGKASISLHRVDGTDDLILDYSGSDSVYLRHGWSGAISAYQVAEGQFSWDQFLASQLVDAVIVEAPQAGAFVVGGRESDSIVLGSDATVRGGLGDDQIKMYGQGSLILFDAGDGLDRIQSSYIASTVGEAAIVRFGAGVSLDDIRLVIVESYAGGGAAWLDIVVGDGRENALRIDINRFDVLGSSVIGAFEFADGSSLSFADLVGLKGISVEGTAGSDSLTGSSLDDRLLGGEGPDSLYGLAGSDWLDGGGGNDFLDGGENGDVYVYRPGEGDDWVREFAHYSMGDDTLVLQGNISPDNIMFGRTGRNLTIRVREQSGSLVIEGQLDNPDMQIEHFLFADGTLLSAEEVLSRSTLGPLPIYLRGSDLRDVIDGDGADDQLFGLGGNDSISGYDGNDVLSGDWGQDALWGGGGSDYLDGGDENDTLYGGLGDDWLDGASGADNLLGEDGDDQLSGGAGDDVLRGGIGRDLLQGDDGHDDLYGGMEDDVLVGGEGDDALMGEDGNDILHGEAGNDWLVGNGGSDQLFAGDGADTIYAIEGDDYLEGGAGDDRLFGGLGNDSILGGDDSDLIHGDEGSDTIWGGEGTGYLYGGAGDDALHGGSVFDSLNGDDGNDLLFGYAGDDRFWDGAGDDELHGGDGHDELTVGDGVNWAYGGAGNDKFYVQTTVFDLGMDTLVGGAGDDTYCLWSSSSTVSVTILENAAEGVDVVYATADYTLGENVENLTLAYGLSAPDINGWGNAQDNVLRGNEGVNQLAGGAGNDSYFVSTGDSVIERAGEGEDTLYVDCDWFLSGEVENLVLTDAARNATGSATNNVLVGNSLDNVLDGGAGTDRFEGGLGNDLYILDGESEVVIEWMDEGVDTVQSALASVTLADNVENVVLTGKRAINATGNSLGNRITGNAAINVLAGGGGNDVYVVGAKDSVVEAIGEGVDTIISSLSWQLGANLDNLELTGSSKISGTGNELDNRLTGNSAANTLSGGKGNDTYVVGLGDKVSESVGEGNDTVLSAITWTLSANVENLTLIGISSISAIGNGLSNRLRGNVASNTLQGGSGDDIYLFGRGGGQDLIVDSDNTAGNIDRLLFDAGIGHDQLWFRRESSSLVVNIIGSNDQVVVSDWYSSSANQVERIEVADGQWLSSNSVDALVQAMAQMQTQALAAGQTELSADQWQQLQPVLSASWQAA